MSTDHLVLKLVLIKQFHCIANGLQVISISCECESSRIMGEKKFT
jgi:hypothetical protein